MRQGEQSPRMPLSPRHRWQLIRESGIAEEVISRRGYATVTNKAELTRLGFAHYQRLVPALLMPMYRPDGEPAGHQIRPDEPRRNKKPDKTVKYETPSGSEVRLDVHPSQARHMRNPSMHLYITEGVKKGDSLVSRGLCVIALQGVNCWQQGGLPLREWEDVKLHGRLVTVVFDSDVMVKPAVQKALAGLVGFLEERGAIVRIVYLPDAQGGKKQGVDDYLVAGGTIQGLEAYAEEELRAGLAEVGRSLADIQPEPVLWLWPRRVPRRKITILDGDPDNGKSLLTVDVAARITAGLPLPDGTPVEAAGVVIVSAEDGAADTIRPRFDAAGGDPTRVRLLGDEEIFTIPEDLPSLEVTVNQVGASLVIIDPIMAFLSSNVNSNNDQDVRRALMPLKSLAERTGASVLMVRHLNKTPGGSPLYRGGGSIAIIGTARSGMVVGRHPEDDELRVLAGQKNNLSLPPDSLAYRIETADNGAARIVYEGITEINARDLLKQPADEEDKSALSEAKEFLVYMLERHPMSAKAVEREANGAGISDRTLKRAKQKLGVKSAKESDGSWTWHLPKEKKT